MSERLDIEIASKPKKCQITVGRDLASDITKFIDHSLPKPSKILIISDVKVKSLDKSKKLVKELKQAADVTMIVRSQGEETKCSDVLEDCLDTLAVNSFSRDDVVVALGGGVIGDVAGLSASLYRRGIRFIQVPTSLLAMVDASVGGKTAINWGYAKNLIGSFWQPTAVFADVDFLDTLEDEWWRDGFGEVLKCSLLAPSFFKDSLDPYIKSQKNIDLVELLKNDRELLEKTILACIRFKASVVREDEREEKDRDVLNSREILNFGHTLGHALERVSDFSISHGRAVMLGIVGALGFGVREGLVQEELFEKVRAITRLAFGQDAWRNCVEKINALEQNSITGDGICKSIVSYDKKSTSLGSVEIILPGYQPIPLEKSELEERFVKPALRSLRI